MTGKRRDGAGLPPYEQDRPYSEAARDAYRAAWQLAQLLSHADSYGARRVDRGGTTKYCSVLLSKSHAEGEIDVIAEATSLLAVAANQLQLMRTAEGRTAADTERERRADAIGDFLESLGEAEAVVGQLSTGERHALMRRWLGLEGGDEDEAADSEPPDSDPSPESFDVDAFDDGVKALEKQLGYELHPALVSALFRGKVRFELPGAIRYRGWTVLLGGTCYVAHRDSAGSRIMHTTLTETLEEIDEREEKESAP